MSALESYYFLDYSSFVQLFGGVCLGSKSWLYHFLQIFEIGSKFASKIFQQIDSTGRRVPQRRPTSVQGGTPQWFPQTGREQKRAVVLTIRANGFNIEAQIWKFGVFWVLCFDVFPYHLSDGFQLDLSSIWEIILACFCLFKICSNIVLKLIDLCKCTRRPNGILQCFRTLHSYEMFMIFQSFFMLMLASFEDRFWKPCRLVLGLL